jgi:hypothetical protein
MNNINQNMYTFVALHINMKKISSTSCVYNYYKIISRMILIQLLQSPVLLSRVRWIELQSLLMQLSTWRSSCIGSRIFTSSLSLLLALHLLLDQHQLAFVPPHPHCSRFRAAWTLVPLFQWLEHVMKFDQYYFLSIHVETEWNSDISVCAFRLRWGRWKVR